MTAPTEAEIRDAIEAEMPMTTRISDETNQAVYVAAAPIRALWASDDFRPSEEHAWGAVMEPVYDGAERVLADYLRTALVEAALAFAEGLPAAPRAGSNVVPILDGARAVVERELSRR